MAEEDQTEVKPDGIENLKVLENIDVELTVEVGRTEITIRELLRLNEGSCRGVGKISRRSFRYTHKQH